jgi:hypothetical protein
MISEIARLGENIMREVEALGKSIMRELEKLGESIEKDPYLFVAMELTLCGFAGLMWWLFP